MMRLIRFVSVVIWLLFTIPAIAQKDSLATRPPMGWNSWNHFHRQVDDATIRSQAEAMVSSGMRDAGYLYVNIDDTWGGRAGR